MDSVVLNQDRVQCRALVIAVMNLLIPYNTGKLLSGSATSDLSRNGELYGFRYGFMVYMLSPKRTISSA
jgi:hypothetical protein